MRRRGIPGWVYVDFLAALVSAFVALLFLALAAERRYTVPPALRTPGIYAIVATWPGVDDDVDLYCRDPQQRTVYFASREAGLLHLEHDDLGYPSDGRRHPRTRTERQILEGVEAGRFSCSVHLYRQGKPGPVHVRVSLHRLIGADATIADRTVTLEHEGQEQPAFTFTVAPTGRVSSVLRLPIYIAAKAWGQ